MVAYSRHNNLVGFNMITGDAISGTPEPDGPVYALENIGDTLFMGGDFMHLRGDQVNRVAKWNTLTDKAEEIGKIDQPGYNYPGFDNSVRALTRSLDGKGLYIGGYFTGLLYSYNSKMINPRVGQFPFLNNLFNNYGSGLKGGIKSIKVDKDGIYLGGDFDLITHYSIWGSTYVHNLAKVNFNGIPDENDLFNKLNPDNSVNSLLLDQLGNIYAGGDFGEIGFPDRTPRYKLSKQKTDGNIDYNFMAWTDNNVNALAYDTAKKILYAGGAFTNLGPSHQPRSHVAALDPNTCEPLSAFSDPQINNDVYAILLRDNYLYAGGRFTYASGNPAENIAVWKVNDSRMLAAGSLNFKAEYAGENRNRISWNATAYSNNDVDFIIERSNDGIDFTPIITVKNAGYTKSYEIYDPYPSKGANHYWLRLQHLDGSYT